MCMQGRNVVLESKYGSPKIVNDGVTVAKEVELEDPVENIGAKLVRQVRPSLLMHCSRSQGPAPAWREVEDPARELALKPAGQVAV